MEHHPKYFTACVALAAGLCLAGAWPARAGTIAKADNTLDLTNSLSWVGGVAPASTDVALWN
ncbi:MAG: hypothetical protein P4M10_01235, partial [Verrucomicrobiae bacterium]|nr:hypothetical protein [Verrucomicrobiae bacterium]